MLISAFRHHNSFEGVFVGMQAGIAVEGGLQQSKCETSTTYEKTVLAQPHSSTGGCASGVSCSWIGISAILR